MRIQRFTLRSLKVTSPLGWVKTECIRTTRLLYAGPAKTARAHGTYKPVAETYPDEKERRISILSRMKNILAAGLTSAVLLGMMAIQSFSGNPFFMHLFMPMG